MKIDLEKMNREDLLDLRKRVDASLETLADREREAARKAAEEAAKAHGFSLAELGIAPGGKGRRKAAASKAKTPPKFRNPENPDQTWSGRGRRPQWIKDAEAAGMDLAAFRI